MRHTILVLDDEERLNETLTDYLNDMGHAAFGHADATAALEALQARDFTTAIVDIRLPGIDGLTFMGLASRIRPELRYIIHTGSLEFADREQLRGANDRIAAVLIKPVSDLQEFSDILERMDRGA